MIKNEYSIIGVMSGTSLDGIDMVYTTFNFDKIWTFKIIFSVTVPYEIEWIQKLNDLVLMSKSELRQIDEAYTSYLAQNINSFMKTHNIHVIDAICSHGHTAWHQPQNKLTYQIGNLPKLATLLKQTVVCDFRVQDVDFGGQGAPLVPIGDALLFSKYEYCLNLGGFANISLGIDNQRIAYDICPVNIVLNYYVKQLGFEYDNDGMTASTGMINMDLLNKLNDLDFYRKPYPKSLGLEWVKSNIFPLIDSHSLAIKDVLRTFVEHVAIQISKEINLKEHASVLVTGGGAYHGFLMNRINALTNNTIIKPSKEIIEYKEALIFGFLGVLKLRAENNCLKSVTGALHDHSSGKIFHH
ncbi:MAG: anhydro-N-acetylmuramic acid kinase [Flavobacteriales bacterium]|nr:anhydro-N-acetylmuramic acid kinase [Flavobacteriia bacterium]NCP06008.1 anhydro-N-acetylmuramic acid kinase [Flavobacteriales bacterium]PIV92973.1 MAG: anhydro-N-acetylmuramic acid kinase [Flavobacteriaceae bacterium CG17_big_fil_post_rev_8_21_14_2_50_33_15]PIY12917.1 MAG: anhydro-N-acetylmuramic acid kinase [Flavobacteriaceae bacterium CG_4_10_14_3_um_filter_33_47]PJB19014.1 MAG: anhydro-N-acetylmuramic acid kinase [Flavobacteriaceae bacterium CG_4_9_14_3_um_filter_33_16]